MADDIDDLLNEVEKKLTTKEDKWPDSTWTGSSSRAKKAGTSKR